jgi:hypothetical protein
MNQEDEYKLLWEMQNKLMRKICGSLPEDMIYNFHVLLILRSAKYLSLSSGLEKTSAILNDLIALLERDAKDEKEKNAEN